MLSLTPARTRCWAVFWNHARVGHELCHTDHVRVHGHRHRVGDLECWRKTSSPNAPGNPGVADALVTLANPATGRSWQHSRRMKTAAPCSPT